MGSLGAPGFLPTVYLFLKLPDGSTAEIGAVHAVPPEGADISYADKRYRAKSVVWELRPEGGPRVRVIVEVTERP